jgi:hypothetical protein
MIAETGDLIRELCSVTCDVGRGARQGSLAIGVRAPPPIFSDVWQGLELQKQIADVWQGKELREDDCGQKTAKRGDCLEVLQLKELGDGKKRVVLRRTRRRIAQIG